MDDKVEGTTSGQLKATDHTQQQRGAFPSQKEEEQR